jgi:hypothetical protein
MPRAKRFDVEGLEARALLSDLSISLTTDKGSYVPGESIHMTLTETNVSNHDVNIYWGPSVDGFQVVHDGVPVWAENEGAIPAFIISQTLKPGESYKQTAIWSGKQDQGSPVDPNGTFAVLNEVAPSGPQATFNIGTPAPTSTSSVLLPLTANTNPFGTKNPDVATAEVRGMYRLILDRNPDPVGLAAGVSAFKSGTPLASVALTLLHSNEYETRVVAGDYRTILGRAGTTAEIATWVARMDAGMSAESVAQGFFGSDEFAHGRDNGVYIESFYEDIMGRPATPSELSSNVTGLNSGVTNVTAVATLVGSVSGEGAVVGSLYATILGRSADVPGLTTAVNAMQGGKLGFADVAANLFGSAEFAALAKKTVA